MRRIAFVLALLAVVACGDSTGPVVGRHGVGVPSVTSSALSGDSMLFRVIVQVRAGNDPAPGVYWSSRVTRGTVSPVVARSGSDGTLAIEWRAPQALPGELLELIGCVADTRGRCAEDPIPLLSVSGPRLFVEFHQ